MRSTCAYKHAQSKTIFLKHYIVLHSSDLELSPNNASSRIRTWPEQSTKLIPKKKNSQRTLRTEKKVPKIQLCSDE